MSNVYKRNHRLETFADISDSEAEFWTSKVSKKRQLIEEHQKLMDPSSDVLASDGLYFKTNNQFDEAAKDQLASLFKENLAKQAEDVNKEAEKKSISEIFEFDEDIVLNENIPGVNMSFLDRLIHQLTRPRASMIPYQMDEEFAQIDANEITSVANDSFVPSSEQKYHPTKGIIQQFMEDIHEEIDVIFGVLRPTELAHQRSERAKLPFQSNEEYSINYSVF